MRYPKLNASEKKRVLIDSFRGYEHTPVVSAGAFYDMENLSGDRAPLLRTRPLRKAVQALEDCPARPLLAMGGRGATVVLDSSGTLWCGSRALPRLLAGATRVSAVAEDGGSVTVSDPEAVAGSLSLPGEYRYRYREADDRWSPLDGGSELAGGLLTKQALRDGDAVTLSFSHTPFSSRLRELVFMGGWVCVFPDGKFVNTVRLRQGEAMRQGEDYGELSQSNTCEQGRALFQPCGPDGELLEPVWAEEAPSSGYWVDSTEPEPTLRLWSQSQGLWQTVSPYVKCSVPGIARGLRAEDSVELSARFADGGEAEQMSEALWSGSRVLTAAWHDPGDETREEGSNDYLILPGLLPEPLELELSRFDGRTLSVTRPVPEMDFVVEAGNRLWGCRCGDGVNELYGSKLGDFRNWNAFEGLSTDSYRVSRGHDGPYTGAAVLGGCPLFFRADCLEKIYPSAQGDHGVVTVSLEGIEAGSARSAVVIRDRLYYKSEAGVCCYNGTLPVRVSRALGDAVYRNAVAGARGSRWYYISMQERGGANRFFVLDTETGFWYREESFPFAAAYSAGERLYLLPAAGGIPVSVGEGTDSTGLIWWAETGELGPRMGTRRYVTRLQVSARLEPGGELRVYLSYDGGPWLRKGELQGNGLQSVTFPVFSRRCTRLRLRLEGCGGMELHALSWLTEAGSDC